MADTTDNTVDNDVTLTFVDDSVWSSRVTAVKIGNQTLDTNQYIVTNGELTIQDGIITTPGNYTITVEATGYQDSSVVQTVNVGAFSTSESTAVLSPNPNDWVYEPQVNVVTLTAKDQYGNPIPNYTFRVGVEIENIGASDITMVADGQSYTVLPDENKSFPLANLSQVTDANGVVTLSYHIPSGDYNAAIWVYPNDSETAFW
ncbi:DUF1533 domain-containing protein [Brevibacillus fluminis]|uniref:DUF1533 domain-containing protein n=1 Tax=Brevibacillus fluminis TaxID=511487 RepID=UPI001605C0B8|nr:DUF1533 domain-containing protein [Brevibacillus fluminis]